MSPSKSGAKHRAQRRPVTPLTTIGQLVTGPTARKSAAAAASTGIIITLTATGGLAAPVTPGAPIEMAPPTTTVSEGDSIASSVTVSVAKDAKWSFTSAAVGASSVAPPPPPPPVVRTQTVSRSYAAASRSNARQAAPASTASVGAPATATGAAIIAEARKYIGTPYRHGGGTPSGFDCSGFTAYVFAKFGYSLPRSSGAQRGAGRVVSAAEARPGDLVWWPGHVGIYTGNGNHIAARNPSTTLYESRLFRSGATYIRVAG